MFDWQDRRPKKPNLLVGPEPDEEGSGLRHERSMRMMGNEEMKRDGDSETDLPKIAGRQKNQDSKLHFNYVHCVLLIRIKFEPVCVLLTTVNGYDWVVVLSEGA